MGYNWQKRWTDGTTGWDLNGPHPFTSEFLLIIKQKYSDIGRWLVPGCGRAHDAAYIATNWLNSSGECIVDATDIILDAIDEAKKLYSSIPNLHLYVDDALILKDSEVGSYDAIFDRAMMCALDSKSRQTYIENCFAKLRVGGIFISLPFTKVANPQSGPPFEISPMAFHDLLLPFGNLVFMKELMAESVSSISAIQAEMAFIFMKRE